MTDPSADDLRRQAAHCRRLAKAITDDAFVTQLEAVAADLERRADEMERQPRMWNG